MNSTKLFFEEVDQLECSMILYTMFELCIKDGW